MANISNEYRNKFQQIQQVLGDNIQEAFDKENSIIDKIMYEICRFEEIGDMLPTCEAFEILKEVQNDLLNSIIFACQGFYRNSFMCLRSAIELFLSFLYYYDHAYDFLLWKNDFVDMTWGCLIDCNKGIFNEKFIKIVSDIDINVDKLKCKVQKVYHEMSQSVHGKYAYMQINISEKIAFDSSLLKKYCNDVNNIFEIFKILLYVRFKDNLDKKMDVDDLNELKVIIKTEVCLDV